jgi:uncharacterized protein (DUF2132 family)
MNDDVKDSVKNTNDKQHGLTLSMILRDVVDLYGYKELARITKIKSFEQENPTLKPILKFLRKTPWAREKVELLFKNNTSKIEAMKAKKLKLLNEK